MTNNLQNHFDPFFIGPQSRVEKIKNLISEIHELRQRWLRSRNVVEKHGVVIRGKELLRQLAVNKGIYKKECKAFFSNDGFVLRVISKLF